ncbi:MAG: DUF3488 domain-containing protein [Planctomycetes bacterium]|nr:DUF3488 domain-containing protein [Planctomycetota bacterium]
MNAQLLFRRAAMALVLVSVAAFSASERNGWILVVGGLLAVAAGSFTHGPRGRALPPWVVRLGVIAAIGWGAAQFAQRPSPEEAPRVVGGVVLAAMLLKLWDRKQPSDWRQVIALSIVLVVASALVSGDFLVGVLVIGYAMALVATTMLYQLHAGAERAAEDRSKVALRPGALPPMEAPHGASPVRHLRRLSVVAMALGVALSALVFLLFPRDSALGGGQQSARTSGFRADISLWRSGRISLSSRVAMTVQLLDPRGAAGELTLPLRMRGAVLEQYFPGAAQWRGDPSRSGDRLYQGDGTGAFQWFATEARNERSNVWTQVVEMRSLASDRVFSAWMPLAIACDESRSFVIDSRTAELSEAASGIVGKPRSYSIRMQAYPSPRIAKAVVGAAMPEPEVDFPVPEVRTIAERIVAEHPDAEIPTAEDIAREPEQRWIRNRRLANLFTEHLSGERFRYSTDLSEFRRRGGEDPIVLFLDRYRFGHCEYFASALVALCRSMGAEARVVTGYMTTEYDSVTDRYVFRESGAHAWAEVRTGEWQWGTFDPSPMDELLAIQRANRTWMDSFRWILDPVEFMWNSRFASFDSRSQAELGDRVATGAKSASAWFTERAGELVERANRWFLLGPAGALWLALVGVTALIAVAAAWVVARRARRASDELGARGQGLAARLALGRDARFYLDALDALARAGMAKPAGRTPGLHADALRASHPEAGEAFADVVRRFYAVRYAGIVPSRADRADADAAVSRLRAALARGYTST